MVKVKKVVNLDDRRKEKDNQMFVVATADRFDEGITDIENVQRNLFIIADSCKLDNLKIQAELLEAGLGKIRLAVNEGHAIVENFPKPPNP